MEWYDLPRLEKTKTRLESEFIQDDIEVINLDYGIHLYRNAVNKDDCKTIIDLIENEISLGIPKIQWNEASVNGKERTTHARNCYDLKYKKEALGTYIPKNDALAKAHDMVNDRLNIALQHYERLWHFSIKYKEAFNFVKYMPGEYFKIHADHGPFYTCTVSAIVYLNDDYEGGELEFPRHGLIVKPKAGDIMLFPSNYVYEHASLNISSGIKYAVVIMMDYNDLYHKAEEVRNSY
jgi:predicted 2-oxoglutarate/Fe(II)-dependent dioxygenase YbiX